MVNIVLINESLGNFLRCHEKYFENANHDCMITLLNFIMEMDKEIMTLTSSYEDEKREIVHLAD